MPTIFKDTNIPIVFLHECFFLVPPAVHWRVRPRHHFSSDRSWRRFNTVFSGKQAGATARLAAQKLWHPFAP
jgi:hypothetical protein